MCHVSKQCSLLRVMVHLCKCTSAIVVITVFSRCRQDSDGCTNGRSMVAIASWFKKKFTCPALIGLQNFTLDWRVELIVNKSILFQYDKLITFSYEGFWWCRQNACHIHREARIPNPSRRIAIPTSNLKESTTSTFRSFPCYQCGAYIVPA